MSHFETCATHIRSHARVLKERADQGLIQEGRIEVYLESYLDAPAFFKHDRRRLLELGMIEIGVPTYEQQMDQAQSRSCGARS